MSSMICTKQETLTLLFLDAIKNEIFVQCQHILRREVTGCYQIP